MFVNASTLKNGFQQPAMQHRTQDGDNPRWDGAPAGLQLRFSCVTWLM